MRTLHALSLTTALITSCSGGGDVAVPPEGVPAGAPTQESAPQRQHGEARYAVPLDGLPTMGASDALVTMVEFTDYDCPYCAKAERTVSALRSKYGAELRVAVAEHPLPMHPHARDGAMTALAAAGTPAFESLHAKLFENPEARSSYQLAALAISAGLDRSTFERARTSEPTREALAKAEALAEALHLRGTPLFFINGRKVSGAQPIEVFDAAIAQALAEARELVASGVSRERVYDFLVADARSHPAPIEVEESTTPGALVAKARGIGGAPLAGRVDASTTIVMFTDFECAYCRRLDVQVRELAQRRDDVRVVVRNRPLGMHEHARLAAKAAIAADLQGKHEAFAKLLFAHPDALDRAALGAYAVQVGLDVARFDRDLDSEVVVQRLHADEALADELGVSGTPTSFVEGRRIDGAQSTAMFEATIKGASADVKR